MPRFTTLRPVVTDDDMAKGLRSAAAAAAKLTMASYDPEDRADCAAAIVSRVLTGSFRRPVCGVCHGPASVLSSIMDDMGDSVRVPRCYGHGGTDTRMLTMMSALPPFSHLYRDALDFRKSLERSRARDAADAAERARMAGFIPAPLSQSDETSATPHGARKRALDMLRAMGLTDSATLPSARRHAPPMARPHGTPAEVLAWVGRMERIRDSRAWPIALAPYLRDAAPVRSAFRATLPEGPVWTSAYAAARAAAGLESEDIARELGVSYATLRAHLSRVPKRIPSVTAGMTRADHAAAIVTPEPLPHGVHVAGLETDWRTRTDPAPVSVTVPVAWVAAAPARPSWAILLRPATDARLAHAAGMNRARRMARTAAERDAIRAAAVLPGEVR